MINIAFVHSATNIGGAEKITQTIIGGLTTDKFRTHIVCPAYGPMLKECRNLGAKPKVLPMRQPELSSPLQSVLNFLAWSRFLRSNRIDVIHTGDLICTRSVIAAAIACKIPIICHMHFSYEMRLVKWVFSTHTQPFGFIFCGNELKERMEDTLSECCPKAIKWVVHNGVNTHFFHESTIQRDSIRIGIVANLQERKGHEDFLQMAQIVSTKHDDVSFEIIGGDIFEQPRESILRALCDQLGIARLVTFHGQVSDVRPLLNTLDIIVCASHQEAFPVSILEAMSCGLAVVSTDVNGIPEAVIHKETGLLVPPHNPKMLASAVNELLNAPNTAASMGKKGRVRVLDYFSETIFLDRLVKIYEEAGMTAPQ